MSSRTYCNSSLNVKIQKIDTYKLAETSRRHPVYDRSPQSEYRENFENDGKKLLLETIFKEEAKCKPEEYKGSDAVYQKVYDRTSNQNDYPKGFY